jgi:hypothetical protein
MPRVSRRTPSIIAAIAIAYLGCAWPRPAAAQPAPALEAPALVNASLSAMLARSAPFASFKPPPVGIVAPLAGGRPRLGRPRALPPLYVSFAVLQGLDLHSTLAAVDAGGREANPLVGGLLSRPGAMVGAKLAATVGTVLLTERLWRRNRGAAVALMVGVNAAFAAIVASNYRARER